MKSCQRCRAQLGEFLDGTLTASAQEEVAAHLESCPDCQKELREMKADRAALREWSAVAAPADLRARVRSTLQNEARTAPAKVRPDLLGAFSFWRPQKLVWSGSLTLSAIALLLLTRTYSPTSSLEPSAPQGMESTKAGDTGVTADAEKNAVSSKGEGSQSKIPTTQKPWPRAKVKQEPQTLAPKVSSQRAQKAGDTTKGNSSAAEDLAPPVAIPSPSELSERSSKEVPPSPAPQARSSRPEPMTQSAAAPQPKMRSSEPTASSRSAEASANANVMKAQVSRATQDTAPVAQTRVAPRDQSHFSVEISALPTSRIAALENRSMPDNVAPITPAVPARSSADNVPAPAFAPPAPIVSASPMARKSVAGPNMDGDVRPDNNAADLQARNGGFSGAPAGGGGRAGSEFMARRAPRVETPADAPGQARFRAAKPEKPAAAPSQFRDFSLDVAAHRDLKNAQIRVELPPSLRFGVNDASGSRVLWRGDFENGQAIRVNLSLLGGRGGEKISVFLEQNEGAAKSKTLETQMLALPESRE